MKLTLALETNIIRLKHDCHQELEIRSQKDQYIKQTVDRLKDIIDDFDTSKREIVDRSSPPLSEEEEEEEEALITEGMTDNLLNL